METDRIELDTMPQLAEAKAADDDWTGTITQAERRRRQNRLNQRAARRRKAEQAAHALERVMNGLPPQLDPRGSSSDDSSCYSARSVSESTWEPPKPSLVRPAVDDPHDLLSSFTTKQLVKLASQISVPETRRRYLRKNNSLAYWFLAVNERLAVPTIAQDHLLSLVQYNLLRGLSINCLILNLAGSMGCDDMALFKVPTNQEFPPHLMPTTLQETVIHPCWIDLFPLPRARDNLIRRLGDFDEDELWYDICGELCTNPAELDFLSKIDYQKLEEPHGLILWSNPWDTGGWEITPGFVRKWGWVIEGCPELIRSTDHWRAMRAEKPLLVHISQQNARACPA